MRAPLAAALLMASPLIADEPTSGCAAPRVVRLVWRDPLRQLPEGFDPVAREVARVFSPVGIELRWRDGGLPASEEETQVILLADDPAHRPGQIMGRVNPNIRGAFWIYARPVRKALGLDSFTARHSPAADRCLFRRALARVVAHEIVHSLRPDLTHAADGLMQARLRQGELAAREAAFDPETMALLRRD